MKESTTKSKLLKILNKIIAAVFWLAVWEVAALAVDRELLLPSPIRVIARLGELSLTLPFWRAAGASLLRVAQGYLAGVVAGTLFAVVTASSRIADGMLAPLNTVIRATPIASFIILALVWIKSSNVPSFISFLMVTPIVWSSLKTAILGCDRQLAEVTAVYKFGFLKKLRIYYIPSVLPHFAAAVTTSMGLAWKAGIAAEVLCIPKISIGRSLYESKLYLETADLFAWTAMIIILSVIMELVFKQLVKKITAGKAVVI